MFPNMKYSVSRQLVILFLLGAWNIQQSVSAEVADTLNLYRLKSVEVKGKKLRSPLKEVDGASVVSMSLMDDMPRILGNADPLHYAQLLPGIQTNSEYDAGIHIQGCDNSHNLVTLGGAPVYNAAHLLGFFSVFNAGHFSDMSLVKSCSSAAFPNRLGGSVDMRTPTWLWREDSLRMKATHGELSVGPMSSQGTLKMPLGKRSLLLVSARAAYLNLLYSKWLEVDGDKINYDFSDYNLSYVTQINDRNILKFEAYWGYDNVKLREASGGFGASVKWDNTLAALHWYSQGKKATAEQMIYYSRYANRVAFNYSSIQAGVRSRIYDLGYKGWLQTGGFKAGLDLIRHGIQPQQTSLQGDFSDNLPVQAPQTSLEASVYALYRKPLSQRLTGEIGLRANFYHQQVSFYGLSPSAQVFWNMSSKGRLSLHFGIHHQYLFQTGFTSSGLPTEFWFSADPLRRPQYSYNTSLQGEFWFADKEYRLSAEIYFKSLKHQVENTGNIFDLLYSSYSLDGALLYGKGCNYGFNLLVEKRRGRLTGWLSYSYGRARRRYAGSQYAGWFPANHERLHELNAVGTCRLGKRWSIGATFVVASGTPYTHVDYAYLVSGNLVTEYGEHNAERMNPYMRLDMSLNYDWTTKGSRRSGINFSVYNLTMHKNDLFYRLKVYNGHVRYGTFCFLMPILPSINYYYKF